MTTFNDIFKSSFLNNITAVSIPDMLLTLVILFLDSLVRNLSIAEDLAEDTFVKLGIRKPHFSGKSSFKTWLYAIGTYGVPGIRSDE